MGRPLIMKSNSILPFLLAIFAGCLATSGENILSVQVSAKDSGDVVVLLTNQTPEEEFCALTNREWILQQATFSIPVGTNIQIKNMADDLIRSPGGPDGQDWWDVSMFCSILDVIGSSRGYHLKSDVWGPKSTKQIVFNVDFAIRQILGLDLGRTVKETNGVRYRIKFVMFFREENDDTIKKLTQVSPWATL